MTQLTIQESFDLALQHHQSGRLREAEQLYRAILAQEPQHADTWYLLGLLAHQVGRDDAALDCFRRAVAANPNHAAAFSDLGNALSGKREFDEAIAAYRRAIILRPDFAEAYNNLGSALKENGQLDEAIAAYRRAVAINPDYLGAHSNLLLTMNYHVDDDAQAVAEELREWNRRHAQGLKTSIAPHSNDCNPDRRLRVGYVSGDFYAHASANFLLPLLKNHDPQQVEVFCYTTVSRPDAMTAQLQQYAGVWRSIVELSDEQAARQIREDKIDILVDLKLHTDENRLLIFARKPAPVQATWLGYPGSTGLETIDYRLSDPYLDPPGMDESVYSERTMRLPDTFWCYDPVDCADVSVSALPAQQNGFVTYGCLNTVSKLNDAVLALWAQVLNRVENSRLHLLIPQGSSRQRTLETLRREGIAPSRVDFLPRQSHRAYLQYYHQIDIGLDSLPCNGHTTSLDSFWMGVPVVTRVGNMAVSRAGWCQLSNLKLTALAAQTSDEFVEIAVSLARDLPRLSELRRTLRERMQQSPLMDAPKFARNIEAAYRQMWRAWCENVAR